MSKEAAGRRVEFYVRRDSYDENTFAVVTALIDWSTPFQDDASHEQEYFGHFLRDFLLPAISVSGFCIFYQTKHILPGRLD